MDIDIFAAIQSPGKAFLASSFFHFLKGFGAFAFAVLLVADILLLSKRTRSDWKKAFYGVDVPPLKKSKYTELWERIKSDVASGDMAKAKIAVIEADGMFAETLGKIGYAGKDAGEKIAAARPGQLIGLEEARQAHEIFKKVVRVWGGGSSRPEIQDPPAGFEKIFLGLGVFV